MTTVEHNAFASPLSLLDQWRNDLADGAPLRELVILGFTLDLPFLERFCVPAARQLGARVTVLADAGQAMHDPVDVRFAGRSYQHGVAALPRAFHPKLAVLLGDDHVWFAIGSGNPTAAGWGHNHELWFLLRGTTAQGPRVQAELGAWLQQLPATVPMCSWVGQTLADVGARTVPDEIDTSYPDVRLLHNLDRPLLDGVPDLTASELRLAAPFIDPSGATVRHLIGRATPAALRIAVQRDLSSFDGAALVAATATVPDVEFRDVDDRRTLHGKLIEWVSPSGATTAIVGSPNLTSAALLGPVGPDHNCELAVLAPTASSLLPDAAPLSSDEIAVGVWNRPDISSTGPGLQLLGCRIDGHLIVEFRTSRPSDIAVETSVDGSPGSWSPATTMIASAITPNTVITMPIEVPVVVGGAVRLTATINNRRVESAVLFVTDLHRCRPRTDVGAAPRVRQEYGIDDLITDSALAQRFSHDLLRLLEHSHTTRASAPPTKTTTTTTHTDIDRWQRFLDTVTHSVGSNLAELAFPGALPNPVSAPPSSTWSVAAITDETELADDEDDTAIDNIDPPTKQTARHIPPEQRSRYRGWMRKWVAGSAPTRTHQSSTTTGPSLPLRMTVAAVYVDLLAAGVWGTDDGWRHELADLITALAARRDDPDDSPPESQTFLRSRVAVCLALLLQDASLHGGTPVDITAQRGWEAGHPLAAGADPTVVAAMLISSTTITDARIVTSFEVDEVIALAQSALEDPFAEARAGLDADGFDVKRRDAAWIVRGTFRNPTRIAARVTADMHNAAGVIAVATNGRRSTIMLRHDSDLAVADSQANRWRYYRIRPPATPGSMFAGGDGLPPTRETDPLRPIPRRVLHMAELIGGDLTDLFREFMPPP